MSEVHIITALTIKLKFRQQYELQAYLRFLITHGKGGHIAKKIIHKKLKRKNTRNQMLHLGCDGLS